MVDVKNVFMRDEVLPGDPLAYSLFFDRETDKEIAYVTLEDKEDCWEITASTVDGYASIKETIAKEPHHDCKREYAHQRYKSASILVERLMRYKTGIRIEEVDCVCG